MQEVSSKNFGLLMAYVLPGFAALWGASLFSPVLRSWVDGTRATGLTVGGFLHVTLASVAVGVVISTVRWAVIDTIHRWTGLRQPAWDFSTLRDNVAAFEILVENHYRYYQFHGNAEVALVFVYLIRRIHLGFWTTPPGWIDAGFLLLAVILYVGSRDTLRKYFSRVSQLLGGKTPENSRKPVSR